VTNVADVFSAAATEATWSEVAGNGDAIIDPGETIAVQVTLMNRGNRALTGITGKMSAVGSVANITGTTSDYPDLNTPGDTATNNSNYLLKVGLGHVCGKPLTLAQTITTGDGWQGTTQVSLPTGAMTAAQNYAYPGPSQEIPDNDYWDELRSSINITDTGTIADVNVRVELTHPWVGDVGIILESPDGTFADLVHRPGDGAERGANFRGTTFDDEGADGPITAATAPFTGSFIPLDALSRFDGESMEGEWRLYVYDEGFDDIGTLDRWSLDIQSTRRVCSVDTWFVYLPLAGHAQ
jgi:subtilisin-like proprotein convertase family protein